MNGILLVCAMALGQQPQLFQGRMPAAFHVAQGPARTASSENGSHYDPVFATSRTWEGRMILAMRKRDAIARSREATRAIAAREFEQLTDDKRAASRYRLAKLLFKSGKVEAHDRWLMQLIEEFPDSDAANAARVDLNLVAVQR